MYVNLLINKSHNVLRWDLVTPSDVLNGLQEQQYHQLAVAIVIAT